MGLLARFLDLFNRPAVMPATLPEPFAKDLLDDASPEAVEMKPVLAELLPQTLANRYETKLTDLPAFQIVQKQDPAFRGRLVLALTVALNRCATDNYRTGYLLAELLSALVRGSMNLNEDEYLRLFRLYKLDFPPPDPSFQLWSHFPYPVPLTLAHLGRLAKKQGRLERPLLDFLGQLSTFSSSGRVDLGKASQKAREILTLVGERQLAAVVFDQGDAFGRALNGFLAGLPSAERGPWETLLGLWTKATASQPTAKYRQELSAAVAAVGVETVRVQGGALLAALATVHPEEITIVTEYTGKFTIQQLASMYGGAATITPQGYSITHTETRYLFESNQNVAKGLIWTLAPLGGETLVGLLASYATYCYRKIPGKGPLAVGLGNACLLALSQNGLVGVAALARVRSKIRQTNTQETIARYIAQESAKLGVSPAEIEDMAVPDFGLENGRLEETYGDYTATLTLADGKAEVQWQKAGKPLKSAPAALKATHADELKELKAAQTQAQQTYSTQRDRLDRGFAEERRMPWPWFAQYYFNHGLMGGLTRRLIWRLHYPDGTHQDALWVGEAWHNVRGQPLPNPTASAETVQCWHPLLAQPNEVLAWRELLERHQLRQPLKQAFREVYLLTPPEERTSTYSNRMAAHILKQHQFNSLAKLRGWRYRLLGAYDKGYDSEIASLPLPAHNLTAEYWVSEVFAEGEWNDTGIYNYVSTDQVRFTRADVPVPLPEVPPLAFSEVMRDVDLFVGVASVGNDPQWRDNGGLAQFRDYWESYSFGDLGEVAKSRKLALERLVPRLKIGKVSEIKGNFLVVKGHHRTYKIHLGSGNILMEPNDQYLCIVPDRSAKTMGASNVFLPFEGDAVLSIILSKALLLMDDDKITDQTILRQIGQ